jgi:hypothetical protein
MATRSRIGIRNDDDSVDSIYCHWDGYPQYNGRILMEHYQDESKVRELIALGSLSSLGAEIGEKHDFSNPHRYNTPERDAWDAQHSNICTAYFRDRGDLNCEPNHHQNPQDMLLNSNGGEEYWYIWHYGRWMMRKHWSLKWQLVEDVLANKQ